MSIFATAMAATSGAAHHQGNPMFSTIIMLVAFLAIFYFLIWRPQSRRAKAQRDLLSSVKVGDEVSTSSGIMGKIVTLEGNLVVLEIASGVNITMQKAAVGSVLPKGTLKS